MTNAIATIKPDSCKKFEFRQPVVVTFDEQKSSAIYIKRSPVLPGFHFVKLLSSGFFCCVDDDQIE